MSKLVSNYSFVLLNQSVSLVVPVVTAPYLARVLGAENLGSVAYAASVAAVVTTVGLLGLYDFGNREVAYQRDSAERVSEIFWELMIARSILLVPIVACYLVVAHAGDLTRLFLLYLPWLVAVVLDVSWVFVGLENVRPAMLKNILAKLLGVIGMLVFVRSSNDVEAYVLVLGISTLIANAVVIFELRSVIHLATVEWSRMVGHAVSAMGLFAPQVVMLVELHVSRIMVKLMSGDGREVAFFDQADKLVAVPLAFITSLSVVMMPRMAYEFRLGRRSMVGGYLHKSLRFALMASLPIGAGLFLVAPEFVPLYLGSEFAPTALVVRVLSCVIVLRSIRTVLGSQYLGATDRLTTLFWSSASGALALLGVGLLVIPRLGAAGAAIAAVGGSVVSVVALLIATRGELDRSVLARALGRYGFACAVMALLVIVAGRLSTTPLVNVVVQVVVGCAAYVVTLRLLGDELLLEMARILRRQRS